MQRMLNRKPRWKKKEDSKVNPTFSVAPQEIGCCSHQLSCSQCYQGLMITTAERFPCLHLQSMFFSDMKRSPVRLRLLFRFRNYHRRGRYFSLLTRFSYMGLQDLRKVPPWSHLPASSQIRDYNLTTARYCQHRQCFSLFPQKKHICFQ